MNFLNNIIIYKVWWISNVYHSVSPSDIDAFISGESDDIGELLRPSDLVHERLVSGVLARIGVQPTTLRSRVNLAPNVIGPVEHVARVQVECSGA